jgi:hypothetical protein
MSASPRDLSVVENFIDRRTVPGGDLVEVRDPGLFTDLIGAVTCGTEADAHAAVCPAKVAPRTWAAKPLADAAQGFPGRERGPWLEARRQRPVLGLRRRGPNDAVDVAAVARGWRDASGAERGKDRVNDCARPRSFRP